MILAGLVMLITPGQGVLSILLGLALVDVPGKRTLERKIFQRPPVLKLVNRLRGVAASRRWSFRADYSWPRYASTPCRTLSSTRQRG